MYALYILAYFNLYRIKSKYLDMLSLAVNLFVCVVLMVKFNPFIKVAFTANDTRFIFACSTVLFSNILATNYLVKPYYMKYVRSATPSSKKPKKRSPQRRHA
jgi:FlaA1/EpsC-like NDP-sugar epimerase